MKTIPIWQTDIGGFLLYPATANELAMQPDEYNIPFGAYEDEPPEAPSGYVARRIDDVWAIVEDHRSDTLYLVGTAEQYQIGTELAVGAEVLRYDGGGPIPAWLTSEPVLPEEAEVSADEPASP